MEITYSSYLRLNELFGIQSLLSEPNEHDEMLFIIIHQTYELWFKQILHEMDYMIKSLGLNNIYIAAKTLKRINTILKVIVHQIDILETMTPLDFLSFRDYLSSASGFQSYQFRELEFILGNKKSGILNSFSDMPEISDRLMKRYYYPTLWDVFLWYLSENSYEVPSYLLKRDVTQSYQPDEAVQDILINIYLKSPEIARFCELLIDMDEGLQEWRYRHVKMVERTIGSKTGTGGSDGTVYLRKTLFQPAFPDLWIIRTRFENVNH